MFILIEVTAPLTEHHAVVMFMLNHMRLSAQSLLNCLLLEGGTVGSSLFDASRSLLSNRVKAEEVMVEYFTKLIQIVPDALFSLLNHLCVSQSMCTFHSSSRPVMLVIATNGARKSKFSCYGMVLCCHWRCGSGNR